MEIGHLDDERIQELAAGTALGAEAAWRHLRDCALCRQAVDGYRALFAQLAEDPGFAVVAPDLAERVLQNLAQRRARFPQPLLLRLLLAIAALSTLVVPFLFVSPKPLWSVMRRLLPPLAETAAALWQPIHLLLLRFNGSAPLLVLAGLAFLLAGLADRWLRRRLQHGSA